jgi:LuxR family maltose regulon positive regulatory protein
VAWVDAHANPTGLLNPYAFHLIASPQVLIAQGKFEAAYDKLTVLAKKTQNTGHGNMYIKALTLQVLAADGLGNHTESMKVLKYVLTLAEPEGYVRIFVDEGEPMRQLILDYQENLKKELGNGVDRVSIDLLTFTDKLLAAFSQPVPGEKTKDEHLLEPLNERELDVLRLIATGRSNKEIAEILVVALSTVKWYINNLYSKLGAKSRTHALALAKELELI